MYVGQAGSGGHLLLLDQDGSLQQPVYQLDGDVQAVAVDGDSVFGGGHFTNYCVGNTGSGAPFMCDKNLPRRKVLEVSVSSGQVTSWAPTLDSPFGVLAAVVDPSTHDLWLGGDFTQRRRTARRAPRQVHRALIASTPGPAPIAPRIVTSGGRCLHEIRGAERIEKPPAPKRPGASRGVGQRWNVR